MQRVLVSACLLGQPVRYDGGTVATEGGILARWQTEGRIVPTCPEMAGGLPVPRLPAEIHGEGGARRYCAAQPVSSNTTATMSPKRFSKAHSVHWKRRRRPACKSPCLPSGARLAVLRFSTTGRFPASCRKARA